MATTRIKRAVFLIVLALLLTTTPLAPEVRGADCNVISSLPFTISTPGTYCLTGNLMTTTPTDPAITIQADNVLLDLNGFTITDGFFPPHEGILCGGRGVTIRNGTLKGFAEAIRMSGSFGVIENTRILDCYFIGITVYFSSGTIVRNNQVANTTGTSAVGGGNVYAISVSGSANNISGNDIVDTQTSFPNASANAIMLNPSDRTVIENNRIQHTTGTAIYISSTSNNALVVNNRIARCNNGVLFLGSSGIFRDNIALGCTTPYSGGTNGGNNQ
jgi:parallel beta-helix repeat protein